MILSILILFGISIFDVETSTIPHTLTIALFILSICYCCISENFSSLLTISLFIGVFVLQVILFFIFGENAIGGGDVKILSISMLFLHTYNDIMFYCVFLCLFTFIGFVVAKTNKETHIKYGPYMALSLISTLLCSLSCSLTNVIIFDLFFVGCILLIDILFFSSGRVIDYVQTNFFSNKE